MYKHTVREGTQELGSYYSRYRDPRMSKRRGSDVGGFTKKSRKMGSKSSPNVKLIKKVIKDRTEMKRFDNQTIYTIGTGTSWSSTLINGNGLFFPGLGDASDQRQGDILFIEKIRFRWIIHCPRQDGVSSATADNATVVRLCSAFDHDALGALPQGNVYITTGAANAIAANQTMQNRDNFGRFQEILDETIILQNPNTVTQGLAGTVIDQQGLAAQGQKTVKFRTPVKVNFFKTSVNANITDILHNSIPFWAHCTSTDLVPTLYLYTRTYFKEVK